MHKYKTNILKIILLLFVGLTVFMCYKYDVFRNYDVASTKAYISSFGVMAPIAYIVMFTLVPLTLFPDSILAISGGMVFGVFYGSIYTIIGAVCGATLSFCIAKFLGREIVYKLLHGRGNWFEDGVEKSGFLIILTLRLIPLVPFDVISYGAGLSKIKYKDFLCATVLGIIPGVVIFTNLGDKAMEVTSPKFIAAVIMLILLFLTSYIVKRRISFNSLQRSIIEGKIKE